MSYPDTAAAIVTGGDTGIGAGICRALAAAGVPVMIDYHGDVAPADALVAEIRAAGGRAECCSADISRPEGIAELHEATLRAFGAYTVFVNNAGIESEAPLLELTLENWQKTLAVNLTGAWLCLQHAAKYFVAEKISGRIINISSIHEDRTMPGNIAYCASKGGMRMMMRTAAVELGRYGITVNDVCPGAIDTKINTATMNDKSKVAALEAQIPLGRIGEPSDIGALCAFLASNEAGYISGASLTVDGAMSQYAGSL